MRLSPPQSATSDKLRTFLIRRNPQGAPRHASQRKAFKMTVGQSENSTKHWSQLFDKEKLYSVKEAAEILGVKEVTVRGWVYGGQLTAYQVKAPGAKIGRLRLRGEELAPFVSVAYERDC